MVDLKSMIGGSMIFNRKRQMKGWGGGGGGYLFISTITLKKRKMKLEKRIVIILDKIFNKIKP